MSPLVPLVMFGWIPAVLYLFQRFSAQKAVIVSFITAWLFLPLAAYPIPGLPDYTKMSATCYGIFLATFIYDVGRFNTFKPNWMDIPMLVWCMAPFVSSMTNGLGLYDGVSETLKQTVTWGFPYFLGRLYLGNIAGLRQLAIAIFGGGILYAPLCLLETRISPQLHNMVYGFYGANFLQQIRLGGYRPTVFMQHGLAVGAWMMATTLVGIWLWRSKVIKKFWGIPMNFLVPGLIVTFIMCKSTGAYILLGLGVLILFVGRLMRSSILLAVIVVVISAYVYLGATGAVTPERRDQLVAYITQTVGPERAESFEFRLKNEEILSEKARERPIFGWGGWGRNRVYNEQGDDISVTDSLWIIAFGVNGAVGLISLFGSMLIPALYFCVKGYPAKFWNHPKLAPVIALIVIVTLFMFDCALNAMLNPVFTLACGGITGLLINQPSLARVLQPRPRPRQKVSPQRKLASVQ